MRIFLVGDGPLPNVGLCAGLSQASFNVEYGVLSPDWPVPSATSSFDAIILDLAHPDQVGLNFVAACRSQGNGIPIILLTTVVGIDERVRWLDAGIDACLVTPFDLAAMVARLRALVRRRTDNRIVAPSTLAWGDIDRPLSEVEVGAGSIARRYALSIAILAGLAFLGTARAQDLRLPLTPGQRQAIGEVVKEYLLQNPEVLRDASMELERRSEEQQKASQTTALAQYRSQLLSPRGATIIGNPNGRMSLVAFFDYNCPYCRASVGDIQKLVDNNPELRVVLRELPILGPDSTATSRLALAVARETTDAGLRTRFYETLMKAKGSMTGSVAFATATSMGLDSARLKSDLGDSDLDAILRENFATAEALGVNGTPAFVIGDQVIIGAVGVDRMQATLSAAAP
jgi:protein-disulfide isomerase/DNA-binding response OmpR family regulator